MGTTSINQETASGADPEPFCSRYWRDRAAQYAGPSGARLRKALDRLPLASAFNEAAIATRTRIREKRRSGKAHEDELALLYWLAGMHSFKVPYSEALDQPGYAVLKVIPPFVVNDLPFTYDVLGYKALTLLNRTDRGWITEAWGEPKSHTTLYDLYPDVWEKYEAAEKQSRQLRAALFDHVDDFYRTLAEQPPPTREPTRADVVTVILMLVAMCLPLLLFRP